MDSHIKGPMGGNSYGSVVSAIIARVVYAPGGDPQAGHDIFRTTGATAKNPVAVRGTVDLKTAFNGSGVVVKIVSTDLNGGDQQDFIASGASAPVTKVFTSDRIFQGVYTVGTGGSAGEVSFLLEAVGKGIREFDL